MEKPNGEGFTHLLNAARCSIQGIVYAFRHESAFRQELLMGCVLFPAAFWLADNGLELAVLLGSLLLVLAMECINSAVEAAIDRISTERHPLSKQAKDLGSAAVFFTMMIVVVSWVAIGLDKLN